MPRTLLPWLILATVLVSALLAWWTLARNIGGEAAYRLEHRNLAPFHEIEIGGVAAVTLLQSGDEAIDVKAPGHGARVDAQVTDGRLVIRAQDRRRWWSGLFGHRHAAPPQITVRFRTIDVVALTGGVTMQAPKLTASSLRIVASGGSRLSIDGLEATSLHVDGSGALEARLAGRVEKEDVRISGAGAYRALHLRAADATVSVSGVASVLLRAERTLHASISGAGVIEYVGDPVVTEHVSGIGRVRRREPDTPPGLKTAQA